jgi:hypothetical protein
VCHQCRRVIVGDGVKAVGWGRPRQSLHLDYQRVSSFRFKWAKWPILGCRVSAASVVAAREAAEAEGAPPRKRDRRGGAPLVEAGQRFESACWYAPIGMALVALDGRWTRGNGALCATITGYSESVGDAETLRLLREIGVYAQAGALVEGAPISAVPSIRAGSRSPSACS